MIQASLATTPASMGTTPASLATPPASLATPLASLPVDDWQFWVATALAAGCVGLVLRPLLPRRAKSSKPAACPGCPSGDAAQGAPRAKHVDLTLGGKRVKP